MSTLARAVEYQANGLAIFPLPPGEKSNGQRWAQYRHVPLDGREVRMMFNGYPQNVAVITGAASGNLVALDCDTRQAYQETALRLNGLGIPLWTIRRPPNGSEHDGGGTHILRTPSPVASMKIGAVDVLAEGRYFLAPDSVHPGGGAYRNVTDPHIFTLPDLTPLAWLNLQPAPPPHPRRRLPDLAWHILRGDPQTLARYDSRSEAEAALCASLARAGYTFDDALRLLQSYPGSGKFAELHADNPRNAIRYLGLTWGNAETWIAEHDNDAGNLARRLRQWALFRPWRGRGASSDRAVYLAHCDIVERCGRDPHGASVRELAELAGIGWKTASRANWRLVEAELLELVTEATVSLSHVWRMVAPPDLDCEPCKVTHSINTNVMDCVTLHNVAHDAFRWGGLNKSGAEVLTALSSESELSVNDLAALTGRHRTTVKRVLMGTQTRNRKGLFQLGLVEPLGDDYWRVVDNPDLDKAARELGTAGTAKRQREKHIRDRRYNRELLRRGVKR